MLLYHNSITCYTDTSRAPNVSARIGVQARRQARTDHSPPGWCRCRVGPAEAPPGRRRVVPAKGTAARTGGEAGLPGSRPRVRPHPATGCLGAGVRPDQGRTPAPFPAATD